ncbi:MAG: hypothetical protein JSV41_06470 [Gemmatimonadota bacterium]|nr:MAG: hypothetical protein JSV41_06470 [Gemmatimonadota bacterium]
MLRSALARETAKFRLRRGFALLLGVLSLASCREPASRDTRRESPGAAPDQPVAARPTQEPARAPIDVVPEYRLRIDPATHSVEARLEIDLPAPDSIHLLFRGEWDGYPGLESRLRRLEAWGPSGALPVAMGAGQLGPAHHIVEATHAERVTVAFTTVLTPPQESHFYHRASQLDADGGHLLGADLLPRVWVGAPRHGPQRARLWFSGMPGSWRVATIERRAGTGYETEDIMDAVFVVGRLRTHRQSLGPRSLTTAIHGRWPVPDERVVNAVNQIAGALHRIASDGWAGGDHLLGAGRVPPRIPGLSTGGQVIGKSAIVYVGGSGPGELEFQRWMYTTAHELLHWYIPTAFRFRGTQPSWFAEGFTDYVALKTLLVGELIAPQNFLDEIAARLTRYRESPLYGERSIAEAQADFWEDDVYRYIYDGGAAAAFLLDLGFQDRGGSLERALKEARRGTHVSQESLTAALGTVPENEWIQDWLTNGANPDWDERLERYRLVWRNGRLVSLDGWATDVLSSIRP